jgi:hypothetical protein
MLNGNAASAAGDSANDAGQDPMLSPINERVSRLFTVTNDGVLNCSLNAWNAPMAFSEQRVIRPDHPAAYPKKGVGKHWATREDLSFKKRPIRDDLAAPSSESAFSLNWITSCLATIWELRQADAVQIADTRCSGECVRLIR